MDTHVGHGGHHAAHGARGTEVGVAGCGAPANTAWTPVSHTWSSIVGPPPTFGRCRRSS